MERKIVVMDIKTNSKREYLVENLDLVSDLYEMLENEGYDLDGCVLMEGISRTTLSRMDQQVPREVVHNGEVRNDLVIVINKVSKKFESGSITRSEMYVIIKKNNLEPKILKGEGKNYTLVGNKELMKYIDAISKNDKAGADHDVDKFRLMNGNSCECKKEDKVEKLVDKAILLCEKSLEAISFLLSELKDTTAQFGGCQDDEDEEDTKEEECHSYSNEELADIVSSL